MCQKRIIHEPLEEAYLDLRHRLRSFGAHYKISADDVDDLLHDAYLRMHGQTYCEPQKAKGRMYVILRNLIIDKLRLLQRRNTLDLTNYEDCIESEIHETEDKEWVRNFLDRYLTEVQKKIMTLLINHDMEYSQIASELGMSEAAVRTNVSRARKTLKEQLKNGNTKI